MGTGSPPLLPLLPLMSRCFTQIFNFNNNNKAADEDGGDEDLTDSEESVFSGLEDSGSDSEDEEEGEDEESVEDDDDDDEEDEDESVKTEQVQQVRFKNTIICGRPKTVREPQV